ncbi:glycosyltransferase family 2 protein [Treponema sp.]|uniref:glycosyltransferase family 2 protein n=1 Tax=Treponema sp. TaxID=166 RepID=UPI003FD88058
MEKQISEQYQITPKISCIVPVYNVEKYLRRCVDSILNQTFTDFELILVDDGSPDNSPAICDEYAVKDSRIKVIHKVNGGVSSARNVGLDVAKGEWICFVDSDDLIEADYMQKMYEAAINNNSDFIMCGIQQIAGYETLKNNYKKKIKKNTVCKNRREFLQKIIRLRSRLENAVVLHSPVNKLFCASLLNGIRFREDLLVCEDYVFNLHYFYQIKSAVFLYDELYVYLLNTSSATHNFKSKYIEDILFALSETKNFYDKNHLNHHSYNIYRNSVFYQCLVNYISEYVNKSQSLEQLVSFQNKFKFYYLFFGGLNIKQFCISFLFKLRAYWLLRKLYIYKF